MSPLVRHSCSLTVLCSRSGVLTKRITLSTAVGWQIAGFSAGAWFSVHERPLGSFKELAERLDHISSDSLTAIVRGRLLPGVDCRSCRRLSDRTAHGDSVTFAPAPRRWLALDVDGVPEPLCLTFAAEPEAGVEYVLGLLPEPFAEVSCWWQATGSAGIKPGVRCRLWFWLSRPVSDSEAKSWLVGHLVDRSLFTPVALHYTAPPILATGTPDPVIRRSGVRRGLSDVVEVPDELPVVPTIAASPVSLDAAELTAADLEALALAALRSRAARAIWAGERTFPDRSTGHFAFAAALAHAGCTDPNTLHRTLIAYDLRQGHDTGKILRADYARRTIAAALAAEKCR